jgi:hypothetical protein
MSCLVQGILAVRLVRARGLGGWSGEADPYVTLTLTDDAGEVDVGWSTHERTYGQLISPGVQQARPGCGAIRGACVYEMQPNN